MARILVVEDDRDIAMLLEDDLASEGHEVEVVQDGEAASRRGRESGWDLIILDVMLPRRDGFDVCRLPLPGVAGTVCMRSESVPPDDDGFCR